MNMSSQFSKMEDGDLQPKFFAGLFCQGLTSQPASSTAGCQVSVNFESKLHRCLVLPEQGVEGDRLPGQVVAGLDAQLERVLRGTGPDG